MNPSFVTSLSFFNGNLSDLLICIPHYLSQSKLQRIITLNPEILVRGSDMPPSAFKNAIMVADGVGIRLLWRWKFKKKLPKITGIELTENLLTQHYKVYILGSKPRTLTAALKAIQKKHPTLQIDGYHGYFSKEDTPAILAKLIDFSPQIILIGMGFPKQEELLLQLEKEWTGNGAIGIGVGGAIDVIAGDIPRAPIWIQKLGLEWLFRLCISPARIKRLGYIGKFLKLALS